MARQGENGRGGGTYLDGVGRRDDDGSYTHDLGGEADDGINDREAKLHRGVRHGGVVGHVAV